MNVEILNVSKLAFLAKVYCIYNSITAYIRQIVCLKSLKSSATIDPSGQEEIKRVPVS